MGRLRANNISLNNIIDWSIDFPDTGLFFICGSDIQLARQLFDRLSGADGNGNGTVTVCGYSLYGDDEGQCSSVRSRLCGYVMNNLDLFGNFDVRNSIILAGNSIEEDIADRLIGRMQLGWCADKKVSKLAVKDKVIVAIARALVNNPKVLFIEDPVSKCDAEIKENIYNLYSKIAADRLVVVCTDDVESATFYGSGVIKCDMGRIAKCNMYDVLIDEPPMIPDKVDHENYSKPFSLIWNKFNLKYKGYWKNLAIVSAISSLILILLTIINIDESGFYEANVKNTNNIDVYYLDTDINTGLYGIPGLYGKGKDYNEAVEKYIGEQYLIRETDSSIQIERHSEYIVLCIAYESAVEANIIEGKYPTDYDEVLLSSRIIEGDYSTNIEVGSTVTIGDEEFTVCGISDDQNLYAYLSPSYLDYKLKSTTPISILGGNFNVTECDETIYLSNSFMYAPYNEENLIIGNKPENSNEVVVSLQCAYRLGYTEDDIDQLIGKEYEYKSITNNYEVVTNVDLNDIFEGPVKITGVMTDTENATVYTSSSIFENIAYNYYEYSLYTGTLVPIEDLFERIEESGNLVCANIFNDIGSGNQFYLYKYDVHMLSSVVIAVSLFLALIIFYQIIKIIFKTVTNRDGELEYLKRSGCPLQNIKRIMIISYIRTLIISLVVGIAIALVFISYVNNKFTSEWGFESWSLIVSASKL